jgi:SAM-dependent methyltransferase
MKKMMFKMAASVQRLLLKVVTYSAERGVRARPEDVAPLLATLVKAQPGLAASVGQQLASDDAGQAQALLQGVLGNPGNPAAAPEDMDQLINFSAYWRDDWVARKAAEVPAGARVLDAGAGQCRYKRLFAHTAYKAQDFAQYEGSVDGPLPETWNYGAIDYVCDITNIPVETGQFDVVLCTEVLEHVPDPIGALRELVRVTTPGGRLLLTAPLGSGIHQEPYHFYGGFSPYFYERYLADFGCEIVEIKPLGGLLRHVAQEVHRAGRTLTELQSGMTPAQAHVLMDWLPRMLSQAENNCLIEQFTVGYMVEARKLPIA